MGTTAGNVACHFGQLWLAVMCGGSAAEKGREECFLIEEGWCGGGHRTSSKEEKRAASLLARQTCAITQANKLWITRR